VLFDRFITEEQFGWRVAEQCPNALRVLDTEDLHFLRKAREEAVKRGLLIIEANLFTDTTKRELASIFRCDLSLIISEVEMELLENTFKIPKEILHYLPFLVTHFSEEKRKTLPSFENRNHFISIGNFLHAPNTDAVLYLKNEIWRAIKKEIPEAELHIYGAYAPQHITQLHNEKEGFLIKGWTLSVDEIMKNARVCLAPLRFGAGLKGKLLDAMRNGTPSVTTPIGAEGMHGSLPFSGKIGNDASSIVKASIQLFLEKKSWQEAQLNGFRIINNRFQKDNFSEEITHKIKGLQQNITTHRNTNFIGQIIQHQSLQATKFMSKWIEEKNK